MKHYTQISYEERIIIADLWRRGKTYYYISIWTKRKYDTIRNEIERNGEYIKGKLKYSARKAQKRYQNRRLRAKEKERIIENNEAVENRLVQLITEEDLSPEQIAGRYDTVSHQTIYNWIYRHEDEEIRVTLIKGLRRSGKTYRKINKAHAVISKSSSKTMIDDRPEIINKRKRCGDFEGDTVLLNGLERLYTLVDRKSGYTFVRHIMNGYAETIYNVTLSIVEQYPDMIKTITYDNGVEFSDWDQIMKDTNIPIYFAHPYHSWERGTNENTNGLLRQYFPKKSVTGIITASDILKIEAKLNNRPRKRLGWLTPYEVFILGMKKEDFQVQGLM